MHLIDELLKASFLQRLVQTVRRCLVAKVDGLVHRLIQWLMACYLLNRYKLCIFLLLSLQERSIFFILNNEIELPCVFGDNYSEVGGAVTKGAL